MTNTVSTREINKQDIDKKQRQKMLLGIIFLFSPLHKEISVSDIQKSVGKFQRKHQLGYSLPRDPNHSDNLMDDLKDMIHTGLLQENQNRLDSFSRPENLKLTTIGTKIGKESVNQLPIHLLEYLEAI